jgi:hypothetical protein
MRAALMCVSSSRATIGGVARHASLTIAVALPAIAIGLAMIFAVGGTGADAIGTLACAAGLAALARAVVALAAGDADEPRM